MRLNIFLSCLDNPTPTNIYQKSLIQINSIPLLILFIMFIEELTTYNIYICEYIV